MIEMLAKTVEGQDKICKHPVPLVRVIGFGKGGIDLQLRRGWIDEPQGRGAMQHALYMETHKLLKSAILEIPYPKPSINISGYA